MTFNTVQRSKRTNVFSDIYTARCEPCQRTNAKDHPNTTDLSVCNSKCRSTEYKTVIWSQIITETHGEDPRLVQWERAEGCIFLSRVAGLQWIITTRSWDPDKAVHRSAPKHRCVYPLRFTSSCSGTTTASHRHRGNARSLHSGFNIKNNFAENNTVIQCCSHN